MKPEQEAAIKAANARLKAAQDRLDALKASKEAATNAATKTAAATVTVGAISPEVAAKIETLEKSVRDLESLNRTRPTMAAKSDRIASKDLEIDGSRFSVIRAAMARHALDYRGEKAWEENGAEYERDCLNSYYKSLGAEMRKTMTFGDESSGGFLVPPQVRAPIEVLRSATWLDKLPVTRLSGVTSWPVIIPRQTSDSTSSWTTEGTSTTATDPAFDEIRLNKKILTNGTLLSRHLIQSAPGVAEQMARRSISESMTRKLELGLIEGGTGAPIGLSSFSGIGSVSFSSATGDTKQVKVNQMILELVQDNVVTDGAMFLMSEKVWANLYGVLHIGAGTTATDRAASRKMTEFAYIDAQGVKWLAGYKVVTTNNLTVSTTGELYFGKWDNFIFADSGPAEMVLETGGKTLALARQALLATWQECDMTLMHPEAFSKGTAYTVALT